MVAAFPSLLHLTAFLPTLNVQLFFNADEYNQDPLCDPWWVKSVAHTYPYMITDQFKGVKRGSIPSTPCCPAGKYFDMDKPRR